MRIVKKKSKEAKRVTKKEKRNYEDYPSYKLIRKQNESS